MKEVDTMTINLEREQSMNEIFLKNYKIMSVSVGQYYIQVPPVYGRTHHVQKGQRMYCYMSNQGELIFKKTEIPHNDHVLLNVYKVQLSGLHGLRLKVPSTYRDAFDITKDIKCKAFQSEDEHLIYRPIKEGVE